MSRRTLTLEEVNKRLYEKHGNQITIDPITFINTKTKSRFIDSEYGEWWANLNTVLRGSVHPKRTKTRNQASPVSLDEVKQRLKISRGDQIILVDETFVNMHQNARFIDVEYGEWYASPKQVINGMHHPNRWQTERGSKRRLSLETIIQKLKEVHGDTVTIDESTYTKATAPARLIDKDYGEFWTKDLRGVLAGGFHPKRARANTMKHIIVTIDEIKQRLHNVHGDLVVIDETTFINCQTKARFIDKEYGEWWSTPTNVMGGCRHTNHKFDTYKCEYPIVLHWKTQQKCKPNKGWEYAILNWLNQNQYDFNWQVPFVTPFKTKRGFYSKYWIDLLIKSGPFANTYVEIKGRWDTHRSPLCKQKWDWFHQTYPNSQLWTYDKLLEFDIIDKERSHLSARIK